MCNIIKADFTKKTWDKKNKNSRMTTNHIDEESTGLDELEEKGSAQISTLIYEKYPNHKEQIIELAEYLMNIRISPTILQTHKNTVKDFTIDEIAE
jgi:hypothetical protein